jgi:hypothetical protein
MASLFIISEDIPNFQIDGKWWIKPSTGQSYIYLDGEWRPKLSFAPFAIQFNFPLTIFINGIDRTFNLDKESLKITSILTQQIDSASFVLEDYENLVSPIPGEEIVIWWKETELSTPIKIFAGEIISAPKVETAPGQLSFKYLVNCNDYSKRLKKTLAVESYENVLAGDIVKDLIDNYFPEYTYNAVENGAVVSFIAFNYKPIFECIKELAELVGFDWYVDFDRDIHFFAKETNIAPYNLTENSDTGHYKNLKISVDKSQLKNKIIVRGGYYLSNLYPQKREADGTQTSFNLDYFPREPISVYVDSGAGYVQKTLGIDNIDSSGFDFVVNINEKVIKNLDFATLSSGDKIKITYKYEVQVLTQDTDNESIKLIKEIEGGDGLYEDIIVDTTIQSIETAHTRASAELEQYSNPIIKGSFISDQDGWRSGQLLSINMPSWGYANREFLIQTVTQTLKGDNTFWYTIIFATRLKGLTEFLVDLFDRGREIIVRENETLHDLEKNEISRINMFDVPATYQEFTPPFVWSNDAGTTLNKGIWNESQWS